MTMVFQPAATIQEGSAASTHVLIVAAGAYPALLGGEADMLLADKFGMRQLSSPPVSAAALADWFLSGAGGAQMQGFHNPAAPLGSVEMLVAPAQLYTRPDGAEIPVEAATRAAIARAFRAWRRRAASHPENISVFYFCGHGAMGLNDYILPSDFGVVNPDNPWSDAFDIRTTASAMRQAAGGQQYFFIDACRQLSWPTLQPGVQPPALLPLDPDKSFRCFCRLILSSTAEGDMAHSDFGDVSWFTRALIGALSGAVGTPVSGKAQWVVTGETLAATVDSILQSSGREPGAARSVRERQMVHTDNIGRHAFQYLTRRPRHVLPPEPCWAPEGPSRPWSYLPDLAAALPFDQQVQIVEAKEKEAFRKSETLTQATESMLSPQDYFDIVLPVMLRWKGDAATKLNKRVRFRLADMPSKSWTINLCPPEASVTFQAAGHADLTINIASARMQDILDGNFNAKKAIADGEVEIFGDLSTLKRVGFLFSRADQGDRQ
jgi:putative sterol carrier protein